MVKRTIVSLKNEDRWTPKDRYALLRSLKGLLDDKARLIDVRVGSKRVEVDVLLPSSSAEEVRELLTKVSEIEYVKEVGGEGEDLDELATGIMYFNDERYWEAHEVWERLWRSSSGAEKAALNGLILIAAAYVHLQRGDLRRYISVLRRGLEALKGSGLERFRSLEIRHLIERVEELLREGKGKRLLLEPSSN